MANAAIYYRMPNALLFNPMAKKNIMGVREALIQEGVEKGIRKGIRKGEEKKNHLFVKNLLMHATFPISEIASLAGVSQAFVRKIKRN